VLLLQIPLVMFLMTHAYFLFYHALANLVLRRVRAAGGGGGSGKLLQPDLAALHLAAAIVLLYNSEYTTFTLFRSGSVVCY
jgi:hypothetical protein